jgi:enterochelin esterase-like enzyme
MNRKSLAFTTAIILTFCLLAACKPKSATPVVVLYVPNPFAATLTPSPTQPLPTIPAATPAPAPTHDRQPPPAPAATITPPPGPPLGCPETHGQVEKTVVQDPHLSEPMDVNIYLPPCYKDSSPGSYPVLYLIHGQLTAYEQWIRLGVPETADIYFSSGQLKPYIIVMPHEKYILEDWPESSFDDDMLKGLIPWVDSHYHTCSQRSCRGIGGISRGALWAVILGLSHWQTFGVIGAHSLPGSPYPEYTVINYFNAMQPQGYSRLYLDIGDNDDYLPDAEVFFKYLKNNNLPHELHLNPGAHNEIYWQAHIPEYLAWYGQALHP